MLVHLFPQLRYTVAVSIYLKSDSCNPSDDAVTDDAAPLSAAADTLQNAPENPPAAPAETPEDDSTVSSSATDNAPSAPVQNTADDAGVPHHRMALKTNLLYYTILMPNLEMEYLITDRWSIALEGDVAWWGRYSRNQSYRLAIISSEARYWINPRAPWHGMYVGAFAGGGWYDLLRENTIGRYGDGVMAGLSFGYMWPIGKHLSLEAGIGAGYMHTRFKEYVPYEGHHLYQRTKALDYFGPLKLKLSIVWRFWDKNKSKTDRKYED